MVVTVKTREVVVVFSDDETAVDGCGRRVVVVVRRSQHTVRGAAHRDSVTAHDELIYPHLRICEGDLSDGSLCAWGGRVRCNDAEM